jgi:CheY-like chemotaxis protein
MTAGRRVLVVDDDESIRDTLQFALSDEGYEVRVVPEGSAALALLREWHPSVIMLDMKMPGTDGWAFTASYRQMPEPRPPVIVVTAAADAATWAADVGADDVLPKPFDLDVLLATVERHASTSDTPQTRLHKDDSYFT